MTSEIVYAPMNEADARELTARIAAAADSMWELLAEAEDREAWKPLGYPSFRQYIEAEFGKSERAARYRIAQVKANRERVASGNTVAGVRETARLNATPKPQPASHPPSDGDRSTHPAPEVPPAPSSPSPDEEVMPDLRGDPRPADDTPPAAEPSEPGVAGVYRTEVEATHEHRWTLEDRCSICGNVRRPNNPLSAYANPICTDPAHADLLGLLGDLDRLLLPRDEEDWRAWDLGDQEAEGRALMARVRSLLGQQASDLSVDGVAPDVDGSDLSEEPPGADLISGSGVDAGAEITEREEPPDPRIAAIGRTVARMPAKDRARFLRAHRITDLELWLDGLDGDELDSALRLLGLVGAETA